MLCNIRLAVELDAPPAEIYAMYLDPGAHGAITGGAVEIAASEGAKFYAFGRALSGQVLHLVPGKRVVQTWRSNVFRKTDADSIVVMTFVPKGRKRTLLDLQHLNVPVQDYAAVSRGWEEYYFAPWRKYVVERNARHRTGAQAGIRPDGAAAQIIGAAVAS